MANNYTYGIIGAMDNEIDTLVGDLENKKEEKKYGLTFYLGKLKKYDVVIVKCGIGKVNAGRTTQVLISEYSPKYIINTGIAGGLNQQLNIGDIVISTDLIQYDFDVTAFGYAKGYMFIGDNKKEPTKYMADKDLTEKMKKILEKVSENRKVFTGRVLTGDMFISKKEKREELVKDFDGFCCEMEGAAIAQVASLNSIPFTVVRLISDLPNGQGPEDYNKFEKEAGKMSSLALETFLDEL
jgi:adenosylhomocysteine nucleosidase